jgi:hypothetical protein
MFFHQWYDIMILVFPFWYCMKHGIARPITWLFCALIVLAWYTSPLIALLEAAQRHVQGLPALSSWMTSGVYVVTTILLYATIAYLIYLQFPKRVGAYSTRERVHNPPQEP